MQTIKPHLWYDTQAVEAATLYTTLFEDSRIDTVSTIRDTPSGDCDIVSFELFGQPFMSISAGPLFTFNPSVSFIVSCADEAEVDRYWATLAEGGTALMPLDAYPFSKRYGWTQDRFGLSWQVMLADEMPQQRITPVLMFVGEIAGKAEEAIGLYTSIFPNSSVGAAMRYGPGEEPDRAGTVRYGAFTLDGVSFAAMDSAREHDFGFNEAISFMVQCDSQGEIDRFWDALSAVPEAEQCGWLKDRFGLSWQIAPSAMERMLAEGTEEQRARVTQAFLPMKKFDLAKLQQAYEGG